MINVINNHKTHANTKALFVSLHTSIKLTLCYSALYYITAAQGRLQHDYFPSCDVFYLLNKRKCTQHRGIHSEYRLLEADV